MEKLGVRDAWKMMKLVGVSYGKRNCVSSFNFSCVFFLKKVERWYIIYKKFGASLSGGLWPWPFTPIPKAGHDSCCSSPYGYCICIALVVIYE